MNNIINRGFDCSIGYNLRLICLGVQNFRRQTLHLRQWLYFNLSVTHAVRLKVNSINLSRHRLTPSTRRQTHQN